jgi:phage terminase large subunit-like protein
MFQWTRKTWGYCHTTVLIENAGYGVELYDDLRRSIGHVQKISPGPMGDKVSRAEAASDVLESGNCWIPGYGPPWQPAMDEARTPAEINAFVHSLATFPFAQHDDDADAWSQAMNWLRAKSAAPARGRSLVVGRGR